MPTEFFYCAKCEKPFKTDDIITTFKHGRLCMPCWHNSVAELSLPMKVEKEKNGL